MTHDQIIAAIDTEMNKPDFPSVAAEFNRLVQIVGSVEEDDDIVALVLVAFGHVVHPTIVDQKID